MFKAINYAHSHTFTCSDRQIEFSKRKKGLYVRALSSSLDPLLFIYTLRVANSFECILFCVHCKLHIVNFIGKNHLTKWTKAKLYKIHNHIHFENGHLQNVNDQSHTNVHLGNVTESDFKAIQKHCNSVWLQPP